MASFSSAFVCTILLMEKLISNVLTIAMKNAGYYPNNLAFCFLLIQETQEENKCYTNKVFSTDDTDKRGHDWEQVKKKKSSEAEFVNLVIYPKAQSSFRHLSCVSLKIMFCYKHEKNEFLQLFGACWF